MTPELSDVVLAHHPLLVAIPAFVPAIALAATVLYIVRKDRREEREESQDNEEENP